MPFFDYDDVRIHYEDVGTGFPLLLIPGGGLVESTIAWFDQKEAPFDPRKVLGHHFRCITSDLRISIAGESSGPLDVNRPWDAITDDHLGLMDHLGIDKFMVIGFCIGAPFVWNILKRAGDRVVAAVSAQPCGFRSDLPTIFYDRGLVGWGPEVIAQRPEITQATVDAFLTEMFVNRDFVLTADREFVSGCQTPLLVMPDDTPSHSYEAAMESALLAPNAQLSLYPWKESKERIAMAVRHLDSFLRAHEPVATT